MTPYVAVSGATHSAEDLTTAEAKVRDFVVVFFEQYGRFPTYREVRVEFAYDSLEAAYYHVQELKKTGRLTTWEDYLASIESGGRRRWPRGRSAPWWW